MLCNFQMLCSFPVHCEGCTRSAQGVLHLQIFFQISVSRHLVQVHLVMFWNFKHSLWIPAGLKFRFEGAARIACSMGAGGQEAKLLPPVLPEGFPKCLVADVQASIVLWWHLLVKHSNAARWKVACWELFQIWSPIGFDHQCPVGWQSHHMKTYLLVTF